MPPIDNPWVTVLLIFVINIFYVSFLTMRMILTLKGYRYLAAFVSVLEVLIYIVGLGMVMNGLDKIENIIAYALGFGAGIIVGMKIEEMIALGYIVINVTTAEYDKEIPKTLRDLGYGVTHYAANGRDGDRLVMQILTPRRFELKLMETVKQLDPKAFIIAYEPKNIHGGFWVKGVRSKKLRAYDTDEI
ncbi:DUF2179 domain-containing protein [Macrococcus armenti]|uniref:DUF2179 domain-containing protein n=1 Tax=Macrococcus armenti TaxID=2875764 RepID=UPI001CCBE143|nr:DUF2179 domain-containing protein [Macrococcus armenti]UBH08243.1 DUF2179 domain-containing protein [Macrococcus armenti]UBH10474.1 DUF2179 domain-containing protein [Macrococcus armenti]UBH15022.1 DUF2179 domain-containing protein [Macrococcus armenti]UBH17382.1 DUF2179 domain-containing protein [Macrococcus armenti]UBH19647.1 DUF2179 domain-containing protein [Macrococcus armenti]